MLIETTKSSASATGSSNPASVPRKSSKLVDFLRSASYSASAASARSLAAANNLAASLNLLIRDDNLLHCSDSSAFADVASSPRSVPVTLERSVEGMGASPRPGFRLRDSRTLF
jgi:hypothetical protein